MPKRSSRWPLILPVFVKFLRVSAFISFLLPSVLWADLSVNDTLNKYTLYGRKGITVMERANTAKDSTFKGAWVGSDGLIDLRGANCNIGSNMNSKELHFVNGQDSIMGKTDVRDSLWGGSHSLTFCGLLNVGGSVFLAEYDTLKQGLYLGSGPLRVNSNAPGHVWNGVAINSWAKTSWGPLDGALPGVYWNSVRPHEAYGMPFPDTSVSVGTIDIGTGTADLNNQVLTCTQMNSALTAMQCRDTVLAEEGGAHVGVLQPGHYGDLKLSSGTTAYLGEGGYSFNSISMPPSTTTKPTMLLALQPHSNRTVVYVHKSLSIDASSSNMRSIIAPARAVKYATRTSKAYGTDSTQFAGGTMMIYSDSTNLTFNNYLDLWASVTAPSNLVTLKQSFHLYGQVFADSILLDNDFKGTDGAFIPWYPDRPKINFSGVVAASVDEKDLKADGTPDTSLALITISMNHINGDPITVWYHTIDSTATGPQSQSRCRLVPIQSRGKKADQPCEIHIPGAPRFFIV